LYYILHYTFLLFYICSHIQEHYAQEDITVYSVNQFAPENNHRALLLQEEPEKSERHIEIAERREHLLSRAARIERHTAGSVKCEECRLPRFKELLPMDPDVEELPLLVPTKIVQCCSVIEDMQAAAAAAAFVGPAHTDSVDGPAREGLHCFAGHTPQGCSPCFADHKCREPL
jgi:hypothetical protein